MRWLSVRFSRMSIALNRLERARMLAMAATIPSLNSSETRKEFRSGMEPPEAIIMEGITGSQGRRGRFSHPVRRLPDLRFPRQSGRPDRRGGGVEDGGFNRRSAAGAHPFPMPHL